MVCLETSFIIDFLRGKENARIFLKKLGESRDIATITAPTIMEIISGAELEESKREKKEILNLLNTLTILPLDESSSILAGEIEAKLAMGGETIPPIDIMIAAIAIENNEVLATKNEKHFSRINNLKITTY